MCVFVVSFSSIKNDATKERSLVSREVKEEKYSLI